MRQGLRLLSAAILVAAAAPTSAAADDWVPTYPGLAPAASDLTPFAAAGSGVLYLGRFSSVDGGRTWRQRLGPPPSPSRQLVVDPANPLHARLLGFPAGAETLDGGVTWSAVELPGCNARNAGHVDADQLLADPGRPSTVYRALTTDNGRGTTVHALCRSDDAGGSWITLPEPHGPLALLPAAAGAPTQIVVLADRGRRLERSVDGGVSYAEAATDLPAQTYAGLWTEPAHPGRVYAYHRTPNDDDSVFSSDDGGAHWNAVSTPPHFLRRWVAAPGRPGVVLAADGGWVWRSTDGGAHFTRSFPLGKGGVLGEDAGGTIYVAAGDRISRSLDGGLTFSSSPLAVTGGPPIGATPDLADDGAGGVVGVGQWQVTTFDAATASWRPPVDLTGCSPLGLLGIAPGTFLCLDLTRTPRLSRDYAHSWTTMSPPSCRRGRTVTASRAAVRATRILYAAVVCSRGTPAHLLYRSDDAGGHWRLAATLAGKLAPSDYGLVATGGGALLGVHQGASRSLVRSRNGGRTWQRVATLSAALRLIDATAEATYLRTKESGIVTLSGGRLLPGPPEHDPQLLLRAGHPLDAVVAGWVPTGAQARTGAISLTHDGGRTWSPVALPPSMVVCQIGDAALDRLGRLLVTFRDPEGAAPGTCFGGTVWVSPPLAG